MHDEFNSLVQVQGQMVSTDRTSQRQLHTRVWILSYFIALCTYLPNMEPKKNRHEEPTAASVSSYDLVIWTQSSGSRLDEKQTVDQGRTENISAIKKKSSSSRWRCRKCRWRSEWGTAVMLTHNTDHSKSPNMSVPAETFSWMHDQAARRGLWNDLLLGAAGIEQKRANKADL